MEYFFDSRIFEVKFHCNLEKCKGACCVIKGSAGPPVLFSEISIIEEILDVVSNYLNEINLNIIEKEGFYINNNGIYSLNTVSGNDCVFSYYENLIAKCSFQKAFYNKDTDFIKPISCHLFPVRIENMNRNVLKFEYFNECRDALDYGKIKNITVFEFVKDALVREVGKEFNYENIKKF